MRLERDVAQGECAKFLNTFGWAKKSVDAIKCKRCYATVIEHTDTGSADYTASRGGHSYVVEVKAGEKRLSFAQIRADQWAWLEQWERTAGGIAWFWLQLGYERVNSATDYPRAAYLVTRQILLDIQAKMKSEADIDNLPANALAAQTRVATRTNNLHAVNLLSDWRCQWQGNGLWQPHSDHLYWSLYGKSTLDHVA